MNIGIDWHGTFDLDIPFHRKLVQLYETAGHRVYIVTALEDTDENRKELFASLFLPTQPSVIVGRTGLPVHRHIFTGGARKDWFMRERGIVIDYWIDNDRGCWGSKE